jgi:hypothetical protein
MYNFAIIIPRPYMPVPLLIRDSNSKQYMHIWATTLQPLAVTRIGELHSFDLDYVMYMYICQLFFEWLRPPSLAPRLASTCFSPPQLGHSSSIISTIISTMVRHKFALVGRPLTFETLILESFERLRWWIWRWRWRWVWRGIRRGGIRQSWWWELGGIRRSDG